MMKQIFALLSLLATASAFVPAGTSAGMCRVNIAIFEFGTGGKLRKSGG